MNIKFVGFDQSKSSLYCRHYVAGCNEWRGPFPRIGAWATQPRRKVAAVASPYKHLGPIWPAW